MNIQKLLPFKLLILKKEDEIEEFRKNYELYSKFIISYDFLSKASVIGIKDSRQNLVGGFVLNFNFENSRYLNSIPQNVVNDELTRRIKNNDVYEITGMWKKKTCNSLGFKLIFWAGMTLQLMLVNRPYLLAGSMNDKLKKIYALGKHKVLYEAEMEYHGQKGIETFFLYNSTRWNLLTFSMRCLLLSHSTKSTLLKIQQKHIQQKEKII